jgi:SAM-dependent methyltransferase
LEACPLCGSKATERWRADCRDWQQPQALDRYEYELCTECGARFLAERPRESELGKVYFPGYGPYIDAPRGEPGSPRANIAARGVALLFRAGGAAIGAPVRRRLARMLDRAYTPESAGETLLDYGCGAPAFLDRARRSGFTTIGVDFTDDVLAAVRAQGHATYLAGAEFEEGVTDQSVSSVRMNHVVEHLYEPREALAAINRKMRPGGRIHISTPNPTSIASRLFGRRWHALDCPRHVVLYRPSVLTGLLEDLGYRDVSVVHEAAPKDLARSWGIVLFDWGRIEHSRIGALAVDPIRTGIFSPLASLGALLAVGDRYHVFARA